MSETLNTHCQSAVSVRQAFNSCTTWAHDRFLVLFSEADWAQLEGDNIQKATDDFFVAGWHFTRVKFSTWIDRNSASVQVQAQRGGKKGGGAHSSPPSENFKGAFLLKRLFFGVDLLVLGTMDFAIIYIRNSPV